jgi:hypothetical protein
MAETATRAADLTLPTLRLAQEQRVLVVHVDAPRFNYTTLQM